MFIRLTVNARNTRMSEKHLQSQLYFRITFRRYASALLAVVAASEDEAFEQADSSLDDPEFTERYALDIHHRFWRFDEPIEVNYIVSGPDEDELFTGQPHTWVVQLEHMGEARFRVRASDLDSAIALAEELLETNENRHPVDNDFWSFEPEFELHDAEEISPSDWDALA